MTLSGVDISARIELAGRAESGVPVAMEDSNWSLRDIKRSPNLVEKRASWVRNRTLTTVILCGTGYLTVPLMAPSRTSRKVMSSWGFGKGESVGTIKGFWQHQNGKIYAVESTTFGEILGGAGPLDPDKLRDLDDYDYKPAIIQWLERAVAEHKLHRINPPKC